MHDQTRKRHARRNEYLTNGHKKRGFRNDSGSRVFGAPGYLFRLARYPSTIFLPLDAPILKCENIVLTPHTGAETRESYYNVSMTTASDILRVLKGEEPKFCVNR